MSERIRVVSGWNGTFGSWYAQESDNQDVRYTGIVEKQRFHPRLLIRKFRADPQLPQGWGPQPLVFDNFVLETVDEAVEEKYQIVQTFGPDFIFFYGSKPRIFHYSGRLFNTADKPWKNDWQRAWDRKVFTPGTGMQPVNNEVGTDNQRGILSGTNVVLNGGIARLEYDGSIRYSSAAADPIGSLNLGFPNDSVGEMDRAQAVIVREGYLLNFHINMNSTIPNTCNFKFSMFITNTMFY